MFHMINIINSNAKITFTNATVKRGKNKMKIYPHLTVNEKYFEGILLFFGKEFIYSILQDRFDVLCQQTFFNKKIQDKDRLSHFKTTVANYFKVQKRTVNSLQEDLIQAIRNKDMEKASLIQIEIDSKKRIKKTM